MYCLHTYLVHRDALLLGLSLVGQLQALLHLILDVRAQGAVGQIFAPQLVRRRGEIAGPVAVIPV